MRNRGMHTGEIQFDRRAFADFAVNFDVAARLLGKTVDLGQTQAGAMPYVLCCKERVEGSRQHVRRHPASTIRNSDHDVLARYDLDLTCRIALIEINICGFKRELPALGHRIARVDRQIDDGDLELIWIDIRAPQSAAGDGFDRDLLAQRAPKQVRESSNKPTDINRLRSQRGLARESEEALRQRLGAAG